MKKILAVVVTLIFVGNTYAQDDKSFHAGLRVTPMVSWLRPDNTKIFENGGTSMQFGFGLVLEFQLGEKFWLSSGVGFDFDGGKMNYIDNPGDSIGYFLDDNAILTYDSDNGDVTSIDTTSASEFISLEKRRFKANYVTIPLIFKMKTQEIGMMKYYFQFGGNLGIKTKGRADDTGINLSSTNTPDLTDLNIDKELNLIRAQVVLGGGVEYNISGSTWLVGGLDFNWGVTNAVKKKSSHLIEGSESTFTTSGDMLSNTDSYKSYQDQKFLPYSVALRIGVLF